MKSPVLKLGMINMNIKIHRLGLKLVFPAVFAVPRSWGGGCRSDCYVFSLRLLLVPSFLFCRA